MMKKLVLLIIIITVVLFLTSGCADRHEPEDLAVITGFGFDYNPESEMYKLVAQIADPLVVVGGKGGGGSDKPAYWTLSAWGYNPIEALTNLQKKVSRLSFYSHVHLEVYSEELLKNKGVVPFIDALERTRLTRPIIEIAVVKGDVQELLTVMVPLKSSNSSGLLDQINLTKQEIAQTVVVDGREFTEKLTTPGIEAVAAGLELLTEKKDKEKGGGQNQGDGKQKEEEQETPPPVKLTGAAVFLKGNLVGWLNDRETRGYNWVSEEVPRAAPSIKYPGEEQEFISLEVTKKSSKIQPYFKDNQPAVRVEIEAEGRILNITKEKSDKFKKESEIVVGMNKRLAQVIRNDIEEALAKSQSLKSDIFGFGNAFYRKYPKRWEGMEKDWPELFARIPVEIVVVADIKRTGMIGQSIIIR